jgi:acyl carrier protein
MTDDAGLDNRWLRAQEGVEATLFDCLQTNIALLCDYFHGTGTSRRLGALLQFEPAGGMLPTVGPDLDRLLEEAERLLGLKATIGAGRPNGEMVRDSCTVEQPLYVVADAYHLPWTPYHRSLHREHSFLVIRGSAGLVAMDCYHIDTPGGLARPGHWRLDDALIDAVLAQSDPASVVQIEPAELPVLEAGSPALMAAGEPWVISEYVGAYRDFDDRRTALEQVCLETWLLARSRQLSAQWTMDPALTGHAAALAQFAQDVYVIHRRVLRGRPEPAIWPDRLAGLLARERDLVAALVAGVDPVLGAVLQSAAHAFGVEIEQVKARSALSDLPTFNSFRAVTMIEEAERLLGVELPAEELNGETLRSVRRLSEVFRQVVRGGSA